MNQRKYVLGREGEGKGESGGGEDRRGRGRRREEGEEGLLLIDFVFF